MLLGIGYALWVLDQSIFLFTNLFCTLTCPIIRSLIRSCFCTWYRSWRQWQSFPPRTHPPPGCIGCCRTFFFSCFSGAFLYVYAVFPYQYLFFNTTTYALRFDILYLVENLVLVALVGILSLRVQYPWKMIYLHLLGASALYALSSAVANTAIDSGGYVYGKLYGLGLTASACWFVWVPVRATADHKGRSENGPIRYRPRHTAVGVGDAGGCHHLCSHGLGAVPER